METDGWMDGVSVPLKALKSHTLLRQHLYDYSGIVFLGEHSRNESCNVKCRRYRKEKVISQTERTKDDMKRPEKLQTKHRPQVRITYSTMQRSAQPRNTTLTKDIHKILQ